MAAERDLIMNLQSFRLIFGYNYWANWKVLTGAQLVTSAEYTVPAPVPCGSLRGTLVHILEAEWSWRLRFQGLGYGDELLPDVFPTPAALEVRWRAEAQAMQLFLNELKDTDLTRGVRYTTSSGVLRERILWQSLLHVANHGTQHRAEAAALLTGFGCSPGDLDLNVFLDEGGSR